jgi:hypothetical protein
MLRLLDSDGTLAEDAGAAVGALLLEQARLVAYRGGDPEGLLRQALEHLGTRVATVERAAADAGSNLGALDPVARLETWRAAAAEG